MAIQTDRGEARFDGKKKLSPHSGENLPLFMLWAGECYKVVFGQGLIKAPLTKGLRFLLSNQKKRNSTLKISDVTGYVILPSIISCPGGQSLVPGQSLTLITLLFIPNKTRSVNKIGFNFHFMVSEFLSVSLCLCGFLPSLSLAHSFTVIS